MKLKNEMFLARKFSHAAKKSQTSMKIPPWKFSPPAQKVRNPLKYPHENLRMWRKKVNTTCKYPCKNNFISMTTPVWFRVSINKFKKKYAYFILSFASMENNLKCLVWRLRTQNKNIYFIFISLVLIIIIDTFECHNHLISLFI